MFRRSSDRPESASTLIGGGMLAIVIGAVMLAFLAADGFDLGGSRALWGLIMAPLGVVMLIAGIVRRSRRRE
jgi:uncharacterized membrane protein